MADKAKKKQKVQLTLISGKDAADPAKLTAFYEQVTGKKLTQAEKDEMKKIMAAPEEQAKKK
ncbi:MAG: hypothetical protein A3F75_14740 [Betaproteobacteria bacterium RIFCSPLOWO2_12_FULL_64_23]|nr:MAG: hypothetical protein A3F75_14740 [Betaproteobacteria bacterium RIFCSPLOWO2_12_FULL_64_23]